ncbi:MarR family transcriptional regulator [Cupriavidus sp. USMAA2-4]|uniref:MarR family transcriptional regulator n=1 Tax=Cupriavidus malaysiensis TaxID=367825 RepID=A0ABN4TUS6_9BURK|nr:MarR family transcriptional regulator [Cupriavidus sp. USMAA2-4]AOZ03924.1 MarR family transcriptional regulator [Cupriavidus sp. USMAHM13]AOZ11007.1 MarR family transcriptional regulator [Cupriavidus malaysiensis]
MNRLLVLLAMALPALASELGGQAHRCAWHGLPRQMRADREDKTERKPG